jgi:DNA mismatch endonuclease (patch repair protein)
MADNHTKEVRAYNMSRIKSKNTKPEEIVCKYLFSRGLRYRKNDMRFKGKPDIVFPKYKTIVFVHGCFWHMHENCPDFVMPKSNLDYWRPKLIKNFERDKVNEAALRDTGWKIIVVWECELKSAVRQTRLEKLYNEITEKK